jgi:hypothetical protein
MGIENEPKFEKKEEPEKIDEKISEEETLEQREINRAKFLLELAEKNAGEKYTIMNEVAEDLGKKIEQVRAKGIDLSAIQDLDERVEKLKNEAPSIAAEGCLGYLRQARDCEGDDKRLMLASWYWETRKKLEQAGDNIEEQKKEEIQEELDEAAEELGIK